MRTIKISDYISEFLVENGISTIFMISGGGMMHMLDSVGKQPGLNCVFNLNEQASSICAESYGQYTNHLGACMVTTGPGATNAVTGCAGAWTDSTPVLFISGQCRTQQMGQLHGLRIYGAQEIAIVPVVKPITKYAVTVLHKDEIKYHLEKAVYLATHGRRGPVWIDVPLDIQGASVDIDNLKSFDPKEENLIEHKTINADDIEQVYQLLNTSKRPVFLIGHGVVATGKQELIRNIAEDYQIPVLATWRAKGVFGDEEELFMGSPGIPTTRYSNYVLQNADLVIIIGTRLNPAITAYDEPHFAYQAKKVYVELEKGEIDKLSIPFDLSIQGDAGEFLETFYASRDLYDHLDRSNWLAYCTHIKDKYPLNKEIQPFDNGGKVDGFLFADRLSEFSKASDVFVGSSSGRTCGISHMAYRLKQNQRFVTSMGLGSMGWCIPSAIACCIASGKHRTLVMEGDGSLQHNIQELALIHSYHLPIKIFIFSNGGYASIYTMQKNNFQGRLAGCNPASGVEFPAVADIAKAYHLEYRKIESNESVDQNLKEIMSNDKPYLCEIMGSIHFDEIPKSMTIANKDGTFTSSKLENLYPFVNEEEQKKNMPDWNKQ